MQDKNNPDWAPTQKMGHEKIKCNPETVVPRAERVKVRAEKRKKCDAAAALLKISQGPSNKGKMLFIYFSENNFQYFNKLPPNKNILLYTNFCFIVQYHSIAENVEPVELKSSESECQTDLSGEQILQMEQCINTMTCELNELKKNC